MSWPLHVGLLEYRVLVAVATALAVTHAYRKLSPFFAVTWFGAGLLFGYLWAKGSAAPEVLLLPVLLVYLAAALTKGLVETREGLAGNHLLHVLLTGVLAAVVALPVEAAAAAQGWPVPREAGRELLGVDPAWLGGVSLDVAWLWVVLGVLFYGTYKLLDHVGLPRWAQTVALFAVMPLLVRAGEALLAAVG